jgi:hypothetical protein
MPDWKETTRRELANLDLPRKPMGAAPFRMPERPQVSVGEQT